MSACCPHCGLAAPSSQALGLTAKQRQLLQYIEQCADRGLSPSYDEMAHAIGRKSKSAICAPMDSLEQRGYVRRQRGAGYSRSIIVIGQPPLRAVTSPPSPEHRHA